ncbi:Protein-disulfide isomerase [Agreia bicolorata]|uniref:Protein-disulfide isomerase n=2 Tax=Agreia bicolorata TaxID=110935 RepID=A0A1T4WQW6_9MICO|nr:thioredoxin domain-containing protein [Agreia bicolorata]SKA79750.1 Protein-disulfide isomerase [Agreia bicolorata]
MHRPDSRPNYSRTRYGHLLSAAVLALSVVLSGCSTKETPPPTATPDAQTVPALTGTVGAAHLDEGFVQIGSGTKTVDLYVDPMCPYCKLFEETSGPMLFAEAANGTATLRVHPLAILNRLSNGSMYSTRAAAILTAIAAEQPEKTQPFLVALYQNQPAEETVGITDNDLIAIAKTVGFEGTLTQEHLAPYRAWVDQHTAQATAGPLPTTREVFAVQQVPTVIVNGAVFPGNSDQGAAFASFYASK